MKSIRFNYLYRDGGNYKKWGAVVFSNPNRLQLEMVHNTLQSFFPTDGWFIASQIRIPEIFLYAPGEASSDDHCFHEFADVAVTDDRPTDLHNRTIEHFLGEVEQAVRQGWHVFDPHANTTN